MYALITVHQPKDKPKSLEFTVEQEYLTTNLPNTNKNDSNLQREMKAILDILNRLFNEENTEYYIGNKKDMTNVHNKTNEILTRMNTYTKYVTRKNRGTLLGPKPSNQPPFILKRNKNKNRKTRKVSPRYTTLTRQQYINQIFKDADTGYQEPEFHE
jgi:hypothetical protein